MNALPRRFASVPDAVTALICAVVALFYVLLMMGDY